MRERTQLDDAVTAIKKLSQELEDAHTLIELGEMEGDESTIQEGEAGVRAVEKEAARRQIETLLGTKIFLELHVKVAENWQRDPRQLRKLGF